MIKVNSRYRGTTDSSRVSEGARPCGTGAFGVALKTFDRNLTELKDCIGVGECAGGPTPSACSDGGFEEILSNFVSSYQRLMECINMSALLRMEGIPGLCNVLHPCKSLKESIEAYKANPSLLNSSWMCNCASIVGCQGLGCSPRPTAEQQVTCGAICK